MGFFMGRFMTGRVGAAKMRRSISLAGALIFRKPRRNLLVLQALFWGFGGSDHRIDQLADAGDRDAHVVAGF
jgi:hypothetical protein